MPSDPLHQSTRRRVRWDLYARDKAGVMHQISDEHHTPEQRDEFARIYRDAGYTDLHLRRVPERHATELAFLRRRVAEMEEALTRV